MKQLTHSKMKRNDRIEKMLTPDCEFKASESLKSRIMESAEAETISGRRATGQYHWRTAFASCAAVLAIVAAVIIIKPGSTPVFAAETLFARAAEYFSNVIGYTVHFEARTLPSDNFSYINPASKFVEHKMNVCSNGTWSLDKGGRTAVFDGQNVWSCLPEKGFGWKFDASAQNGVLESYSVLLNIEELMHSLESFASKHPDTELRKGENEYVYMLVLIMPAQGDYTNDYAKYSSILDNKTRQMYVFNKADGRLMKMKIDAYIHGIPRTIIKLDSIEYDAAIAESDLEVPENIEWIDMTAEGKASLSDSLPWDEFTNISAEAAVEKMFMALNTGDMAQLRVILSTSSIPKILEKYRGCSLISTGSSFKSGTYNGVFVPCKVRMPDGKTRKYTIALNKDAKFNSWVMDGGM